MIIVIDQIVENNRVFAQIGSLGLGDVRVKTKNGRQLVKGEIVEVKLDINPHNNPPTIANFWCSVEEI